MLDSTDKRLLDLVQSDATLTAQDIGAALGLSASQAGRRRQALEAKGFIRSYCAKLAPREVGLTVQAFVQVQLGAHGPGPARDFARLVRTTPAIVSAFTMTGEADYLLRVYCADLASLNALIHDVILAEPCVSRVHSQIVMDQIKQDAPLPL